MKQKHFWCLSVGVQGDPNMKMTQVVAVRCFWWGGRANVQLSVSRGRYNVMTSITVVVISFKERSQKLLVKECFFFFLFKNWYRVHVSLTGENEWDSSKNEIRIIPRSVCENYNEQPHFSKWGYHLGWSLSAYLIRWPCMEPKDCKILWISRTLFLKVNHEPAC